MCIRDSIQTAARAVGVAQAAYEAALQYAQERQQFGRPIAEFQVIQHKIAHMATDIEAARQLTYYAAQKKDSGQRSDLEAGMAKLFAADMVEKVSSDALQIFGGYGYAMAVSYTHLDVYKRQDLYHVKLMIDDMRLSRAFAVQADSIHPAGLWVRKE